MEIHFPAGMVLAVSRIICSISARDLQFFWVVSIMPHSMSGPSMPLRMGWKWASLKPGSRLRPARSMTLVWGSMSWSMSALVPTKTILLPLTPTAWAISSLSLTVTTLPFLKATSR